MLQSGHLRKGFDQSELRQEYGLARRSRTRCRIASSEEAGPQPGASDGGRLDGAEREGCTTSTGGGPSVSSTPFGELGPEPASTSSASLTRPTPPRYNRKASAEMLGVNSRMTQRESSSRASSGDRRLPMVRDEPNTVRTRGGCFEARESIRARMAGVGFGRRRDVRSSKRRERTAGQSWPLARASE